MSAKTKTSDVVLLHGLGGSKEDWDAVRAALPRSLHATAIDLPGSPGGPKPLDGYDPASLASWLSATRVPLLVVSGALDPLAPPASARAIEKARPGARFVELPGVGHYPMLEAPEHVAELLKEFLRS